MQKIISIMLVLILCTSTLLIGIPQGDNTYIVNILIAITAILSIINNRKRKNIKINIEDIFLIIIVIASVIPIVFNKCVSLNNSVEYALRYISVSIMYFIIRTEARNNNKIINCIINTIIITAIFLIICGIDLMTTKKIEYITNVIIGESRIFTYEIRMGSLFMYPNAFAAYISISIFLVLSQIGEKRNSLQNTAYLVTLMWMFVGVISSESRLVLICLGVVMILYLTINKNNILNNIKNIGINGILAIIFTGIYFKLISLGMFGTIWGLVLVFTLISIIANYILQKIPEKIFQINIKIILIAILAFIAIIIILLNIKSDLVIFKGENAANVVRKQICRTLGERDYSLKLDIEAKSNIENNFAIIVVEKDKMYNEIKETPITIDNFIGTKEININLQEDTVEISIYFKSKESNQNTELRIKSLYVNGKEIILNYKFLPTTIVNKILNSSVNNRNFLERVYFLKSAIVGAIDNNFIGIGGGGWQYIHSKYQEYNSLITEVHSYIGQLIIELGAIGIIAYLGIVILVIYRSMKYIRKQGKEISGLFCAILIIVLHSILDFEMSYFLIMLVTYSLIAILFSKTKGNSKLQINYKIVIIFASIILFSHTQINSQALYSQIYAEPQMLQSTSGYTEKLNLQAINVRINPYNLKYLKTYIKSWQIYRTSIKEIDKEDDKAFIIKTNNLIEKLYKNEPYYLNIEILELLKNNTIQLIKYDEKENTERYLELLLKIYNNIGITNKYRVMSIMNQLNSISTLTEQLKNLNKFEGASKFEELTNEKIETIKKQVQEYKKCAITLEESQRYLRELNNKHV